MPQEKKKLLRWNEASLKIKIIEIKLSTEMQTIDKGTHSTGKEKGKKKSLNFNNKVI